MSLRAGLRKSAPGAVRAPPGPLRDPARSWLTTLGSSSNADDRLSWSALCAESRSPNGTKASRRGSGPALEVAVTGAPRGARVP